jgi:hypothetical protein
VSSNINAAKAMDAVYAGFVPLKTDLVLRFDGAPDGQTMNAQQISYLEEMTKHFIEGKLLRTPSIDILRVHVKNQSCVERQHRQLQDTHELGSLDVFTTITLRLNRHHC